MKKLHLGCGKKSIPGYLNVDIQKYDNVDIVADIKDLPFEESSIDEIYSCAAIEHFGRNEWTSVVSHWYDLLKPGALLRLSTADFEAVCHEYLESKNIGSLLGLVVGGQKDYTDFHGMIFDFELLRNELLSIGFSSVERYDWKDFVAFKDPKYDDYSRSYLPHMDFENGRLLMVNILCKK